MWPHAAGRAEPSTSSSALLLGGEELLAAIFCLRNVTGSTVLRGDEATWPARPRFGKPSELAAPAAPLLLVSALFPFLSGAWIWDQEFNHVTYQSRDHSFHETGATEHDQPRRPGGLTA